MAVATSGELRNISDDELAEKLRGAKEELFNLRFQGATGQLESHGRLRMVRREIARIYTILRERELGITEPFEDAEDTEAPEDAGPPEDAAPARDAAPAAEAEPLDDVGSSQGRGSDAPAGSTTVQTDPSAKGGAA
jgi:large subunit ribosomal protein L29